jgi:thiol-disulfide isomerase/thioredoxin
MDVLAGVIAIVVVVGSSIAFHRIGFDFRGIFALTAVAFFVAGFARGASFTGNLAWKAVRLSVGGFLGTAALIMNNGLHILAIQAGLIVTALAVSAAGVTARRHWPSDRPRSFGIIAGSFALAALGIFLVVPRISSSSAFEALNRPAPPFRLAVKDRTIGPAELRGRVSVLAFWASWCLPCKAELPELQPVYRRFQADPRVAFFAVDTGWGDETAETGQKYLTGRRLDFPMAFDRGDAAKALGVDGVPTLVVIDPRSRVRLVHHGFDQSEDMTGALIDRVEKLLREPYP